MLLSDLKPKYKGRDCLILSCGPSLNDISNKLIRRFAQDKVVICVKLAYNKFADICDIHCFNCYDPTYK